MENEEINLKQELLDSIFNRNKTKLRELFDTIPTIDIAEALEDVSDVKTLIYIFRSVAADYTADFFTELTGDQQEAIIKAFTDKELFELLDNSYADDIVDVAEELPANLVSRVLRVAPADMRKDINQLLNYKDNTAGSLMTTEYIEMRETTKVKDAIASIRKNGREAETVYTIFVRDAKRTLIGTVDLDDLIFAEEDTELQEIMNEDFVCCKANDDQEDVANMFKRYDLNAMAVVNKENKIIGLITIDDVVDIIVEEANEDIAALNQISKMEDPYLKTPIFKLVWKCVPWIMVLMVLQIGTAFITSTFDSTIAQCAFLAAFSPLILDAGGNSGGQTTTMIVRSIAMDEFDKGDFKRVLWKELRVALLIALIVGVFAFALTYLEMLLGIVDITVTDFSISIPLARLCVAGLVGGTLMVTMIISRLIGCCLPFLAKAIHIDPAVMCGPFTTTVVDVVSLLTYFLVWTEVFSKFIV